MWIELDEELAGKARHQRDRQEDSDNRHGGGKHGEADLVRRVDRRLIGGFAHAHVAEDILDIHDRVIDQLA